MRNKVLFAVYKEKFSRIFSDTDLNRINSMCEVLPLKIPENVDKDFLLEYIPETDIIITSWNTASLDTDVMSKAGNLKLLTHAAGSVKTIVSDALWNREVKVTSAASAIAYGVAEFCLGLMLTASKRVFWGAMGTKEGGWRDSLECFKGPFEIYQQKIGIIGTGHVGRHLIRLLKNFTCDILLFDPYCSSLQAEKLGAVKMETLDELFAQCMVVSLNAPTTEETRNMIRGKHFKLLPDGAVFINTARSALVNQDEMIQELRKGRFVACIDVTDPEPPPLDHPLRNLPNVLLTPHEAGAIAQNMLRIGTFVANEIEAFENNQELHFEVHREDLNRIG